VVDAFPYVIPYLVGGIAVIRSETKQRLGDRWAKTVVILVGTESKAATQQHEMAATGSDPFGLPSPPHIAPGLERRDGTLPPPPPAP